ncbi:fatty acid desaturase [Paraburkholderia sp. BL10I2N1]|uniref:fatty acid desaturase n=1 Tax=Paraburkholderia sp. BL10I2N1 TaxID=1938796 RepID=UPI00105DF757|nr:fatty acid desaturase [Paraburkholderia sp. BL10I2N1]TDN57990.1 fatty acid desaturase [Paraburkholderia sp. BL10I2N1]
MTIYLDDTQRKAIARLATSWTWRTQWPTWVLTVTIYGGWFGVAIHARVLGLPLTAALLTLLGAWYMSLQHELLHGHPTRSPLFNALLGFAPLAVWFPYRIYRDSHLQHHDDAHLTQPGRDPESYLVDSRVWERAGWAMRGLLTWRNTFAGRLLLGPAFAIAATGVDALRKIRRGDWRDVPIWLAHFAALAALTAWLQYVCSIPAWVFIVAVGYGSLSLGSIRSFQEHRAAHSCEHRTVINEAARFWRLVFLNNNYHLVHHDLPHVPWFALRRVYETSRAQYMERSGGFLVKGYSEWLRLYAFAPVAHPVHGNLSGFIHRNPPASTSFAGKLRVKFMVVVRRGGLHEADLPATAERQTARQAL